VFILFGDSVWSRSSSSAEVGDSDAGTTGIVPNMITSGVVVSDVGEIVVVSVSESLPKRLLKKSLMVFPIPPKKSPMISSGLGN
jgi:hypothetical protein